MTSPTQSVPPYAALALALSEQHWTQLGQGDDPMTQATDDFEVNVQRVTSLLLVRVMARVMEVYTQAREEEMAKEQQSEQPELSANFFNLPFPETNWSTTNICTEFLQAQRQWPVEPIVVSQIELFVRSILSKYDPDVPYHNASHATHVTISTNKLVDMLWVHSCNTFGLRHNALSLLALVFAAIIHDVEHKGLPNRQLALEDDELAVLYNDQSIAEQRSLYVGFKELLKPDYADLRAVIFPSSDDYRDFRSKVVDLVMNTDIASPERTQLAKSKYVEAFGPINRKPGETAGDEEQTDDEVEDSMLDHVRKMPKNTVKIINKGVSGVTGGVMTVADASVSGVKNVAVMSVSGVKKIGEASMAGMKGGVKGTVKLVEKVAGVRSSSSAATNPNVATKDDTATSTTGSDSSKSPRNTKMGLSSVSGSAKALGKSMRRVSLNRPEGGSNDDEAENTESNDADFPTAATTTTASNKDIMQQARKYTVQPVKKTVRLMAGSINSLGTTLGLRQSKKLGIRVSMDLTGETVEAYKNPRRCSMFRNETTDVIDDLKAAVLMDLIMTAADVSQNLQGYDQMCKSAGRLYNELRKAFLDNRGVDPKPNWFQNQIGFLQFYLAPLSQRLDGTGAYGPLGSIFGEVVENSLNRWLTEGAQSTNKIIGDGFTKFPGNDEWLEYLVVLADPDAEAEMEDEEGEKEEVAPDAEAETKEEEEKELLFL